MREESVFRRYKSEPHTAKDNAVNFVNMDAKAFDDSDKTLHDVCPSHVSVFEEVEGNLTYEYIVNQLTPRQHKILKLRLKEYSLRQIGDKLKLSKETVRLELVKMKSIAIEYYGEVI